MGKKFWYLVLSYGLFLGWLLSFLYNGPALNIIFRSSEVNCNHLAIAYILTPSIVFFYIGFYNIKRNYKSAFMKYSIILCFAGTVLTILIKDYNNPILAYIIAGIMGCCSVLFITGWGCYFVELLNIKNMYKNMAYVICLGYIIFNINQELDYRALDTLIMTSLFICLSGAYWASSRLIGTAAEKKQDFNIKLPTDLLVMMCFLMFLLNIGGGVVQTLISPLVEKKFGNIHIFDISVYFFIAVVIFKIKKRFQTDIIITLSIVVIACGYMTLVIFTKNPVFAYILIILGYAILDIFLWTLVGEMGYIFGRPIKIFLFIMSSNLMAVFMGNLLGMFLKSKNEHIYISISVSSIGAILAFAFLPFINKLMKKGFDEMEDIKNTRQAMEGVVTEDKAVKLLTVKELEIYKLMLLGLKNKEIAKKANITDNTLKGHARKIYKKLGVKNKKELLASLNKEANL
ncbi:response regulator transcription factor [Maledivibacter halophilus]|uniref:Response regulator containing a CheY-like receiver domain and an HTH DNA-binding domain n=1 Tax=Maledivibacter halophilus TaxID=36842 RepID=A0A1T5LZP4_9FIRM|nr:helix-turn-helix transcriptional regulator [Maledivibacter halophilus]SKC81059.1 Response regulator containing a CheY-like receiver domain and an HTH DNA-binding domain [Maledivibacter halophilus]